MKKKKHSCFGGCLIFAPLVLLLLLYLTPKRLKLINNRLSYLTDHISIPQVQLTRCCTLIKKFPSFFLITILSCSRSHSLWGLLYQRVLRVAPVNNPTLAYQLQILVEVLMFLIKTIKLVTVSGS